MKADLLNSNAEDCLAKCQSEHSAAVTALADADCALEKAVTTYDAALGEGREAAVAARRIQGDAEVDRNVAKRMVEVTAARMEEARALADAAQIEHLRLVAQTKIQEFEAAAKRDLKSMSKLARGLARLYAEAGLARANAIRGGAEETSLPSVEQFRTHDGFPREIVKTERVERYIHPYTGDPIEGDTISSLVMSGATPFFRVGTDLVPLDPKVTFDRETSLEFQAPPRFRSFLESLSIPSLMVDDPMGWSPPPSVSPHTVISHLSNLESAPAPDRSDRRERKVRFQRVAPSENSTG